MTTNKKARPLQGKNVPTRGDDAGEVANIDGDRRKGIRQLKVA